MDVSEMRGDDALDKVLTGQPQGSAALPDLQEARPYCFKMYERATGNRA